MADAYGATAAVREVFPGARLELRGYQQDAIARAREAFRAGARAVLLVAPTGAGKTIVGAEIARLCAERGQRIVWVAHRAELLGQAAGKLRSLGLTAAVVRPGETEDPSATVQVCSVQTLRARGLAPPAEMLIIDEAHHYAADDWSQLLGLYSCPRVGLTATPVRSDGRGMRDAFDRLVEVTTIRELTAEGHLVPCRVVAPDRDLGSGARAQTVADAYLAHCRGRRTVVFEQSVARAYEAAEELAGWSVAAAVIHGGLSQAARAEALEAHRGGAVLVNVYVLTEGWDCLSEDTEILTAEGWRGIGDVPVGSVVYSLNRETGLLELTPTTHYGERPTRPGEAMFAARGQHTNIRTTEGHRFHVKYRDPRLGGALSKNWLDRSGADLAARRSPYALPIGAMPAGAFPGVPLSDDELRFVAWFMTDGGFSNGAVAISQTVRKHAGDIRLLLLRLGLDFRQRVRKPGRGGYANASPLVEFCVPKGTDGGSKKRNGWVARFSGYLDKNVAPALHAMTREQFQVFWAELLKGDGEQCQGKSGWLWCDRIEQANAWEHMAIARGFSASHSERITRSGHRMFRVSVRESLWLTSNPADQRSASVALEPARDGERVWCVTNKNGTIVTRRGGKIAIIGNSPETSACILARGCGSVGTYLQIVGRILRPAPGKADSLLVDLRGQAYHQHGAPDEPRRWHLGHGIGKGSSEDRYCQVCGALLDAYPCGTCGFEPEGYTPPPVRITGDELAERYAAKREESSPQRAETLAKWIAAARDAGHKPGAPLGKYKAVYGHWPPTHVQTEARRLAKSIRTHRCRGCRRAVPLPFGVDAYRADWRCVKCR